MPTVPIIPIEGDLNLQFFPLSTSHSGRFLKKIFELQLELAECTRDLGNVRAKYNRALVKSIHAA